ncbi:50S ribosomal protein L22 [candidate division WOR-1 bacterium RIFOXYC2_FULL_37_10]|uniref:Large ribosomal subunit protein uL22 n=1 Tax=candidate division WOR-1 bacterium RIFOXYB2_FULL_37_13 TaxID=1802579 RepID=A0A1F4SRW7_UNCSA|nr:MAG: 50S ribosomal protein L22 [candidate division WOR-1 bacterium RIFOXYA2_FULL_37_7]OGC23180.1 MAG: 50S ribosomal protein L22 [candidate division WOR-1 bacterium RIFOXYB2_FULL_37_13]OGC33555.1 MAG: 50S ribosomal protein L22 [candidate division WOR-1 bacterium RIFOXYC2_FULL_37_10]
MRSKAQFKWIRTSPLKVRRIMKLLRGKKVNEALVALKFMPHKTAVIIHKLIKSAAASAVKNYKMSEEALVIDELFADGAGMLKRHRPRARGRAFPIKKRLSHVTVFVSDKEDK